MDPSSSNFNCEQKGIITYMDTEKYKAALKGNLDAFKDYKETLEELVTREKDTVLHIYLTNYPTESTEFVNNILEMCPSLLKQANIKGETPLHIAARHGHLGVVKVLIDRAKVGHKDLESGVGAAREMLRMTNREKDTALHEAVRRDHVGVVKVLIKEDPNFSYCVNYCRETPLYMAAVRGYRKSVIEMLENCTSYDGPNGKTALHAAVIRGDEGMAKKILDKTTDRLTRVADKKRDGKIALHIAVSEGSGYIVQGLLRNSPDCCRLVDNRGRNVFHFAVESKSIFAAEVLVTYPSNRDLVNEKDFEGNTPLHLLAASCSDEPINICFPVEVDIMAINEQNQSAMDILSANNSMPSWNKDKILKLLKEFGRRSRGQNVIKLKASLEQEQMIKKTKEYHLVVATLIATVTFAASFTLPGGYISEKGPDQGTAILQRSLAFKVFVITNTMAMVSSTSVVFMHFLMALLGHQERLGCVFAYCYGLTVFGMGAMVAAFVTGTYAVLAPSSWLAIVICLLGFSFLLNPFGVIIGMFYIRFQK